MPWEIQSLAFVLVYCVHRSATNSTLKRYKMVVLKRNTIFIEACWHCIQHYGLVIVIVFSL